MSLPACHEKVKKGKVEGKGGRMLLRAVWRQGHTWSCMCMCARSFSFIMRSGQLSEPSELRALAHN